MTELKKIATRDGFGDEIVELGKEERLAALDQAFRGKIPDILLAILRMMVSRGQEIGRAHV